MRWRSSPGPPLRPICSEKRAALTQNPALWRVMGTTMLRRRGQLNGALRFDSDRQRPCRAARGRASGEAEEIRAGGGEGAARRRRLRPYWHDPVEDAARDRAQSLRLARARLLWPRLS